MNSQNNEIIPNFDLFFSFWAMPKSLNLINKIEYIQYKGIKIPRIPLGPNNSINLKEILYGLITKSNIKKRKKDINSFEDKDEFEIDYISIKKEESESDNLKNKDINDIKENNKYLQEKENKHFINKILIKNNNPLNINLKEEKKRNLIPPKRLIDIFNDSNTNIKNNMNHNIDNSITNKNNYNNINNIIFNNINNISIFINNNYIQNIIVSPSDKNRQRKDISKTINFYLQPFPTINNYFGYSLKQPSSSINIKSKLNINQNFIYNSALPLENNKKRENEKKEIINGGNDIKLLKKKRKEKKKNKKMHTASDDDNILRKIQVHFLSFVTCYINDIIRYLIADKNVPLFKNIDYKIKKIVNHKFVEELKSKTIAEILQLRPSPKMKFHDESVNKNIYNEVCSASPFMEEFLQKNYLSLFKEYYYNKNKLFIVNGQIIPISSKTKTFTDLINKNYTYKEKIKYIVINYFLNKYKRLKKPTFKISVMNKNKIKTKMEMNK